MKSKVTYLTYLTYSTFITFLIMDTAQIQKQCEEFLKSIGMPGFIVIGFQTEKDKTQMVYSMKDMPVKGIVKGLTHTLNDLITRI